MRIYNSIKGAISVALFVFLFTACSKEKTAEEIAFQHLESTYKEDLKFAISALEKLQKDLTQKELEACYIQSRNAFKKAEVILAYTDVENYKFLNQPNILKVEEEDLTDIKIKKPSGYQVLEELIFADSVAMDDVRKHAKLLKGRLKLIRKNTHISNLKPYHFLWLIRKEIIRVATTGTTGFDSPALQASLSESALIYHRMKDYIQFFEYQYSNVELLKAWNYEMDITIKMLESGEFDTFNRYQFIQERTHQQLALWNKTVEDWKVEFPFSLAISNDAKTLFSKNTFNQAYFADRNQGQITQEKIGLGKMLFNDTGLSSDGSMSCATCHQAKLAFTDGKKVPNGQKRNSPTILYASLQQGFFYDKRAGSLEGQINAVVNNEMEFHSNMSELTKKVQGNTDYQEQFNRYYDSKIDHQTIRNAIANYVRSLTPFNSKFDRNINGKEEALTKEEIHGFNLFMGKAQCATCHFAPVFNGTVPPEFKETELEHLGVPLKNDTINVSIDSDLGRYYLFQTEERKHFFKTPTIRNISKTAPYMHNGVYETLEEVMDFYNRGGGEGIGIHSEYQTLPTDPLNLTDEEIQAIIAFMHTLEDTY